VSLYIVNEDHELAAKEEKRKEIGTTLRSLQAWIGAGSRTGGSVEAVMSSWKTYNPSRGL
jgi:predicted NUDIX family NTP pyrophosphohydrolase